RKRAGRNLVLAVRRGRVRMLPHRTLPDYPGLEVVPMFDRIANSFALARSSWGVLRTDKKLVLFPILSGIACVLVLLSFLAPFLIRLDLLDDLQRRAPWALGLIGFVLYFCFFFVIIFFNAALVSCALIRFHGGEPTVGDGLRAALARLPQIVLWALVSATVG